jgi:NADPH:quinone reductase-like Zn-dependent oxidoreductase
MESTDRVGTDTAPTERKMRAVVQDRYGLPEVLELRDVGRPEPDDDQVRIQVRASSLNMYDWHMITGTPFLARTQAGLRVPKNLIPGADVAGVVETVGENVTRFRPGDEVFGFIGFGAFAEYVCAAQQRLASKPHNATFEEAAAAPLAGLTALEGLRDVGGLKPGQRVLINGASGGVGTFAVQIAKTLGASVTAVCSTAKLDMVRSIGADHVIDYTNDDFVETERDYDLLFDNVGDRPWSETRRVLTAEGLNVTITGPKHRWLGPVRRLVYRKLASSFGSQRMTWLNAQMKQQDLEFLAGLLESGEVSSVIENTYPLERTDEALRYLGEGHVFGKLVITV